MPERARFIVSKASAGSGKTFQLVLIYLTLAMSVGDNLDEAAKRKALEKRFSRILAITFTNAAVNEMKQRILSELQNLCENGERRPLMEAKLCQTTGLPCDELRRRAKIVHHAILHHYSDLAVCTIDSFANRIVKTFAHDMNLPQNFDISMDETELTDHVADNILSRIGTEGEEELTTLLYNYCDELMEDDGGYNIEHRLKNMIPYVLRENAPDYIAKLEKLNLDDYRRLRKEFAERNREFVASLNTLASEGMELIRQNSIDDASFYYGTKSVPAYFRNTINQNYGPANSYAKAFFEGDKLGCSGCNATTLHAIERIKPRLVEIYNNIEKLKQDELKRYESRKRLMANIYEMGLMKRINTAMEEYYSENDQLHISEITKRIALMIGNGDDAPFIYERIGNVYQNILIDEFQDTSQRQWANLVPLVENSIAEGHTSLVVGDGKQAIYRFREGDVRQFTRLPKVEGRKNLNIENPEIFTPFPKKDNWRSLPEVVKFNNGFFSFVADKGYPDNNYLRDIYVGDPADDEYDLVQHYKSDPSKPAGFVKLSLSKENDTMWPMIADEVERQHQLGYDYSEICVLAPQHKHLSKVSDLLLSRSIGITSKESQRLENSPLVHLIIETMRCVHNPSDRCATVRALIALEQTGRITSDYRSRIVSTGQIAPLPEHLRPFGLEIDLDVLAGLSLYDHCETLLRLYNAEGHDNAYATKLLNIVADYSRTHRQDLAEFLQWIDSHLDKQSLSVFNPNAVPLQTIHTAKGLQWPVVIVALPRTNGNPSKKIWVTVDDPSLDLPVGFVTPTSSSSTIFDEQFDVERKLTEMDTTNAVYVALTRPEQKLIVCAACKDITKGQPNHQKFLGQFAEEYFNSQQSPDKSKNETADGAMYTFGLDHSKPATGDSKQPGSAPIEIESISFPDYLSRIDYAHHANNRVTNQKREFGTMVHDILATIDTASDIEPALKRYAKRNRLDCDSLPTMRKMLTEAVTGAESRRFFANGLKAKKEAPLLYNGKELRPDRIVFGADETSVIDFKTGAPHAEHQQQVREYCDAIRAMGYPSVSGHLLYISESGSTVVHL